MDALELTRSLVRIDSTTGREGPVGAFLAAVLEQAGWIVVRQPVDEGRFNVYAHLGGPEVVFSTHLDTVPPFIDLREDDTWLHGRGTCDAKGLAAAMVAAAERLRATGETRIGLLFVVGEENGSEGAAAAARLEPRGRFLINGEPTENQLTIGQKGVLRANLVATGRAAHSAYPDEGESAIVPLLDTLQRVQRITLPPHPVLGDMTLNIGRIEGGRAPNVIPDHARAELLFRTVMPHDDLKRAIEGALEPRVTVTYPLEIPSVVSTAPKGWQTTVVSFASDLPFLASWGEGYQLGPGTIRVAHTAEERIGKTDLQRGIALYEKLARDLLARGGGVTARVPVAVLGATGTVGQKFVRLLADHPWFELVAVAASDQSAGRSYGEVVRWREPVPLPSRIADLVVQRCGPPLDARVVFSALDAEVAGDIEQGFARAGAFVVTNTRVHRMEPDVPLVVPEVNARHVDLIDAQRRERGWTGAILANPNCSTAALVVALAPLHAAFGVEKVFVATMQAASGAGYPGVPSLDILANVIPFIGGEEEKMERETVKILGTLGKGSVTPAEITLSAHCNRVPVIDGHMEVVSAGFREVPSVAAATRALSRFAGPDVVRALPSSPTPVIEIEQRPDRPQPRLDLDRGGGMAVTVGRVRPCTLLDIRFVVLGHNTIRGAAGAGVQIAELLKAEGRLG